MERVFSFRNPWFLASAGGILLLLVVSALIGFVWLPSAQKDKSIGGLWDAVCGAAGVPRDWFPPRPAPGPVQRPTDVALSAQPVSTDRLSVGRGGTLALRCTMCHGARGVSAANTPNLAGQLAPAIYKQLRDYKSGHRQSAIMQPMVQELSDQDMRDLAAYYASLPRPSPATTANASADVPVIVRNGAPMRNIPPCIACHGGIDNQPGTPWLDGQPDAYLRTQLQAFVNGTRKNDPFQQMRNVARAMTSEEIDAAIRYYASR